MFEIQREYHPDYIIYQFKGSYTHKEFSYIIDFFEEDIQNTYRFIFNLEAMSSMNRDGINMLRELYLKGIINHCDMILCGLDTQQQMMLELFKIDKLYQIEKTLKSAIKSSSQESTDAYYYY